MKHWSDPPVLGLSGSAQAGLRTYVDLLLTWNRRINLIGRADEAAVWERHVRDSLQLLPLVHAMPDPIIDLGSGAGFPGIVLAIAGGRSVELVEADHRKAAFLTEVAARLHLRAVVHAARIEAIRLDPAPVVTARALAPLPRLIAAAVPFLRRDGICVFPKGRSGDAELTAACREWHMTVVRTQSTIDRASVIFTLSDLRPRDRMPGRGDDRP